MSRKFVYYGAGRSADELLLDLYPAITGYSLRKLKSSQVNCITVRRDLDNEELDIGFDGLQIDTSQLLNFVGSGSGYVARKYNQGVGGAIYDAVQNVLSRQPRIVNNGVVELTNGLPSVQYSGSQFLELDNLALELSETQLTDKTSFVVAKPDDTTDRIALAFGNTIENNTFQSYSRNNNNERFTLRSVNPQVILFLGGVSPNTDQHLLTSRVFIDAVDNMSFYYNGNFINQGSTTFGEFTLERGSIGCLPRVANALFWNGSIQEVIFFNDDVISDIADINNNIINYYDIN